MPIARDDLRGDRLDREAKLLGDVLIRGSTLAKVPTGPEMAQVAISARAATNRLRLRVKAAKWPASLTPKVVGSAWMPWLRPMVIVSLCSSARFLSAARSRSMSSIRISVASVSWTEKLVSSTSDEVMPWCTKRDCGPMNSPSQVRKAITSCLVTRSMASIFSTLPLGSACSAAIAFLPPSQIARAASLGMTPSSAMASQACASISNQMRKRFSGAQMAAICGLV